MHDCACNHTRRARGCALCCAPQVLYCRAPRPPQSLGPIKKRRLCRNTRLNILCRDTRLGKLCRDRELWEVCRDRKFYVATDLFCLACARYLSCELGAHSLCLLSGHSFSVATQGLSALATPYRDTVHSRDIGPKGLYRDKETSVSTLFTQSQPQTLSRHKSFVVTWGQVSLSCARPSRVRTGWVVRLA